MFQSVLKGTEEGLVESSGPCHTAQRNDPKNAKIFPGKTIVSSRLTLLKLDVLTVVYLLQRQISSAPQNSPEFNPSLFLRSGLASW